LKSSLDLAINEIVFSRLGIYDDYTRFPIRETKDALIAAIKGAKIYQASEKVSNFIVNVIKPYLGGNDAIWTLHRLNILDKHRLLLPVLQVSIVNYISAEDEQGGNVLAGMWFIEGKKSLTFFPKLNTNMSLTNKGKASLLVLFDKGTGMEKEAVIPTLNYLTLVVERTLRGIEEEFLAENS
jgi:hypothetical protein